LQGKLRLVANRLVVMGSPSSGLQNNLMMFARRKNKRSDCTMIEKSRYFLKPTACMHSEVENAFLVLYSNKYIGSNFRYTYNNKWRCIKLINSPLRRMFICHFFEKI